MLVGAHEEAVGVSNYNTDVDPSVRNSSQTIELEMVGPDKDVLDVGCATGYLAAALGKQGCRVSGIELDAEAAEEARPHLVSLVVGDIAETDFVAEFGEGTFDAVVFGDVLEHLVEPRKVLASALPLLRPGGSVIISVPNVAHGSLRLALLEGRWNYTPVGLLDSTHVSFFTRATLAAMLADAGLQVDEARATILDPLQTEVEVDDEALPRGIVQWVREQRDAMVYQFVVRASVGDPARAWPVVQPAVVVPRVDDIHRQRARDPETPDEVAAQRDVLAAEVVDLHRTVLNLRDHVIGSSAEVGRLRAESHSAARRAAEAEHERDLLQHDLARVKGSASWRIGQRIVRPFGIFRRMARGMYRLATGPRA